MCDRVDENATVTVNGNKAMVTVGGNTRKESQKKKKTRKESTLGNNYGSLGEEDQPPTFGKESHKCCMKIEENIANIPIFRVWEDQKPIKCYITNILQMMFGCIRI